MADDPKRRDLFSDLPEVAPEDVPAPEIQEPEQQPRGGAEERPAEQLCLFV